MAEALVELPCPKCGAREHLPADARERRCKDCGSHYQFVRCTACDATVELPDSAAFGWTCPSCRSQVKVSLLHQPKSGSAAGVHKQLARMGLLTDDPDTRSIGGFTVVGGTGYNIPVESVCSVSCTPTDIRVGIAGREDAIAIPYTRLSAVELSGGAQTSGGAFIGGGFGPTGAVEGMVIASVLNSLSRKTTINTVLRIASRDGEIFLHHGAMTPATMRTEFSPLFTRFEAAQASTSSEHVVADDPTVVADDPTAQLERLTRLRDAGALTEDEFQAARAPHVRRLLDST
jgi:DNA-directed RNA polymerase subunit RPC12/RpoP